MVPTPAALDATSSGVAAPTGAEYVVPGQIAHVDWDFLFRAADAEVKRVRDKAEALSQVWLGMSSNRRPGDSDSDGNGDQPVQVSRKRRKPANRIAEHAEKVRAEAEVQAEEVEAAVASLRGQLWLSRQQRTKASAARSTMASGYVR